MMRVANPCPKTGSWLETNQGAAGPLLTRPFDTAAQLMMSNRITPAWDNEVRKRLRFSGWPRSPAALSAASLERSEAHGEGSDPLNQAVLRTIWANAKPGSKRAYTGSKSPSSISIETHCSMNWMERSRRVLPSLRMTVPSYLAKGPVLTRTLFPGSSLASGVRATPESMT